ncbi:hypothetical protein ES319_D12G118000v1 [Gossypium barbadense]|uniref:EXS domain-containing protein n=1 Tax=Gossypium barbadense TaxID=3634 RepID=A0A5J5NXL4_GOSBA|nr:hypothetical protein ES319_D12G118000v1 [Gossypium barbadense]
MFESHHLRKPTGKSAFSGLVAGEPGNSVQESYVFPMVLGDMKGTTNSLTHTAAAMMPSPIFIWRFQVTLFLVWGFSCCKTMMVWLWGVCLWVFSQSTISYVKIFDIDQNHLTHREIWKCSTWLTIIVPTSMTAYLYLYSHGEVSLAASQPPISFPDFFLADILTSMAKVFSDLERSACRMLHNQVATIAWFEADSICGSHSVAIPLVLVIPYIWRLMQCLRQYKDTKEKTTLFNALKYSTAVPVIFLSALKYHVLPDRWTYVYHPLWLISSFVNSLYSFYWDVTRDWDLSVFTRIFKFNKPTWWSDLLYGQNWVYYWVIGSNLILRCTWTYKLSAHLRHNYLTVFTITALEMLRRFQWIFFRVENEWNKISKSSIQLPMTDIPNEDEKLVDLSDHTV